MAGGVWVVAGAPLVGGTGWRIWYSWPDGEPASEPANPQVRHVGERLLEVERGGFEMLPSPPAGARRMGVRELVLVDGTPGGLYEIRVPELPSPVLWRTLPRDLPPEGVGILIASCFWLNGDKDGFYAAAMRELVQREKPAFKLLMGDQLYIDVWPPLPGQDIAAGLSDRYERYWGNDPYREMLAACPTIVTSDDHEYWNDFPERRLPWPPYARADPHQATSAAQGLYDVYQSALNPDGLRWSRLFIGPVSFFVSDMRYDRKALGDAGGLMEQPQWEALESWGKELVGPGVLVLGQPLLKAGGSKTDRTILDFGADTDRLARLFEKALSGETADGKPHDILILTGDIHTGRLSTASIAGAAGQVHEFVASPASRVTPPPLGSKPSKLPSKLTLNGRRWDIRNHHKIDPTIDDNVGLVRFSAGVNERVRVTLQLWRVRAGRPNRGLLHISDRRRSPAPRTPIHDPIEIQLR
jgi:hypothetical protein